MNSNLPLETAFSQRREGGFGQDFVEVPMLIDGDGKQAIEIHVSKNDCLEIWVGKHSDRDDEGNLFGAHNEGIELTYENLVALTEQAYLELVRRGVQPLPFKK